MIAVQVKALGQVKTSPYKGLTRIRPLSALIAQLGEHCTGIAEVVGSISRSEQEFFSGLYSSSVTAALALMTVITAILFYCLLLFFWSCRYESVACVPTAECFYSRPGFPYLPVKKINQKECSIQLSVYYVTIYES